MPRHIKLNRKIHPLNEVTRKNMVGKTKVQSPSRYDKRLRYRQFGINLDPENILKTDELISRVTVKDYDCTIAYYGLLHELRLVVKAQPKHNVTLQSVIRALYRSIDNTDIMVDCTCADFVYRYAYWATKYGYKYGKPETRPADKTNPNDKIGAMCKHLTSILTNKKWLVKLATLVNTFVKDNEDAVREYLKLSREDFYINPSRFGSLKDPGVDVADEVSGFSPSDNVAKEPEETEELEPVKPEEEEGEDDGSSN